MKGRVLKVLGRTLDSDFQEVLLGAGLAFLLRALGALLAFAFSVAVGRTLGAGGTGLFFTALAATMVLSAVARLGLDNAMLRFVASFATQKDWSRVQGVFRVGITGATLSGAAMAAGLAISAPWLATWVFEDAAVAGPLQAISLGVLAFSLMMLLSECLKGLKRIRNAMLVSGVLWPLFGLLLIAILGPRLDASGASWVYVAATATAALCGFAFWRVAAPSTAPETDVRQELWASARPLWAMAIITTGVLPWAPILLLGALGDAGGSADTGVLGAAARVANLIAFFLVAVNNILAPKFAELKQLGRTQQIKKIARRFAALTLLAASPLLLVLFVAGDVVLGLFGPEFTRGATVLAIMACGQAVNAATGSVGVLLMMTGNERAVRDGAILAAMLIIGLSVALIPILGMVGAAIAAASAIAGMNIYSVFMVRRRLGFWVVPWFR